MYEQKIPNPQWGKLARTIKDFVKYLIGTTIFVFWAWAALVLMTNSTFDYLGLKTACGVIMFIVPFYYLVKYLSNHSRYY